jgi:hypothetical protein
MILKSHMLGEVAEMVKTFFPNGCEVTMENLRILRSNAIAVEQDVGKTYFQGRSLLRFISALVKADRMLNHAVICGEVRPQAQAEELVMRSFFEESKVYDEAVNAYNAVVSGKSTLKMPETLKTDAERWNHTQFLASAVMWNKFDEEEPIPQPFSPCVVSRTTDMVNEIQKQPERPTEPCPFCGTPACCEDGEHEPNVKTKTVGNNEEHGLLDTPDGRVWYAYCIMCGARGPESKTELEAIQEWNRRK